MHQSVFRKKHIIEALTCLIVATIISRCSFTHKQKEKKNCIEVEKTPYTCSTFKRCKSYICFCDGDVGNYLILLDKMLGTSYQIQLVFHIPHVFISRFKQLWTQNIQKIIYMWTEYVPTFFFCLLYKQYAK